MTESRYVRQETIAHIGKAGQAILAKARVAVVGMGALGSVCSDVLARSGVGYLRLIDRDQVELSNLQRCALYTEADVETAMPKALASAKHLKEANSTLVLEPHVRDVTGSNVLDLLAEVDLILDGSDNFELRVLINEAANKLGIPWIYTGVIGTLGMLMPVLPEGPCFYCLSPLVPAPGTYPTCVTEGVLASTTRIAATLEATLALKLLLKSEEPNKDVLPEGTPDKQADTLNYATMVQFDVWEPELEKIMVEKNPSCPVCSRHHYVLLEES